MSTDVTGSDGIVLWPNKNVVVDGIAEVRQDQNLVVGDNDLDLEMEA